MSKQRACTIVSIIALTLSLFTGCTVDPLSMRSVEVSLPLKHRWEEMKNQSFWYTLVWIEGGEVKQKHLKAGEKRVKLWIRRAETVVFCAYPLGVFAPAGGAITPNGEAQVLLSEQEGALCHLLLESAKINADSLGSLGYPKLLEEMRSKADDFTLIDANRLQKDLVNGELSSSSIQVQNPLAVVVSSIPQGCWVGQRKCDRSFWSYWDGEGVSLLLGEGLHCFWNMEEALLLRIFVDLREQVFFVSVQKGPLW